MLASPTASRRAWTTRPAGLVGPGGRGVLPLLRSAVLRRSADAGRRRARVVRARGHLPAGDGPQPRGVLGVDQRSACNPHVRLRAGPEPANWSPAPAGSTYMPQTGAKVVGRDCVGDGKGRAHPPGSLVVTAPQSLPPRVAEVYWRPGCPYCAALRRGLARRGVPSRWHDIWRDDDARRFVRAVNGGCETVPTVRVGQTTLINPSAARVAALLGPVGGQNDPLPGRRLPRVLRRLSGAWRR
jgi:glutaredoxin-like protein